MNERQAELAKLHANMQELINALAIQDEAKRLGNDTIELLKSMDGVDKTSEQAQAVRRELDSLSDRIRAIKDCLPARRSE